MVTPQQVQSIVDLNENGNRNMNGWDQTSPDKAYKHPANDPYELKFAKIKLAEPVSISITGTALDITVDAGTSDCSASVSLFGGALDTTGITYSIDNVTGATIDNNGLVTASGLTGGNGNATITATKGDLSVQKVIVISGQLT